MPRMQAWQIPRVASTATLQEWQHCQHGSIASTIAMLGMPALPVRQHCQHGSIASKTASMIAMPEWQHGQHGNIASTAELPEWELCYYLFLFSFLHAIEWSGNNIIHAAMQQGATRILLFIIIQALLLSNFVEYVSRKYILHIHFQYL